MKMNHLFGAVAACSLLAGAAYAQTSSTPATSDTTAGAQGSVTAPNTPGTDTSSANMSGAGATSGSMSGSMGSSTAAQPGGSDMGASGSMTGSVNPAGVSATSATTYGQGASVTVTTTTNGPIPDTAENRAKYGQPMSHAGKRSAAKGN